MNALFRQQVQAHARHACPVLNILRTPGHLVAGARALIVATLMAASVLRMGDIAPFGWQRPCLRPQAAVSDRVPAAHSAAGGGRQPSAVPVWRPVAQLSAVQKHRRLDEFLQGALTSAGTRSHACDGWTRRHVSPEDCVKPTGIVMLMHASRRHD